MAAVSHGQSGRGGRGERTWWTMRARSGQADGQTGEQVLTRRLGGRSGKDADGRADGGGKGADSRVDGRTGPTRRGHADGQKKRGRGPGGADGALHARTDGRTDGRTGRSGAEEPLSGGRAAVGRTRRMGGQADRRTGGRADE